MKLFHFIFSLLLIFDSAIAQKSKNEGYVVTHERDTVKGLFSASRWNVTPARIEFNGSDGKKNYKPIDIKAFFVADEFYESAIVNVDHSVANTQNLDYSSSPQYKQDTLFLRVLFRSSKVALYYYKNRNGWVYFFIKDESQPIEQLVYKRYLINRQDLSVARTYAAENRSYVGQLKRLFNECPDLTADIENVKYEQRGLEKLFSQSASCYGEELRPVKKAMNLRTEWSLIAGLNQPSIKFHSSLTAFVTLTEGDHKSKVSPDLGIGVSFTSLRRDNLSVNLFFLYSNLYVKGNFYNEAIDVESNFIFECNWISGNMSFGLRPVRSIPLYLTLGASPSYFAAAKSKWEVVYPSTPPQQRDFESSTLRVGLISSISYQVKKVGFEFMYEYNRGISGYSSLSAPIQRVHLLMKYSFSRKEE